MSECHTLLDDYRRLECFVAKDTQACAADLSLQDSQTILCLLLPKALWRQDKQSFCFRQLDAFSYGKDLSYSNSPISISISGKKSF